MSNHMLSDSQGESEIDDYDPLDWNSVELIRKNVIQSNLTKREGRILKQLKELQPLNSEFMNLPAAGKRKSRLFGQRHCLTCDLSDYLGLASKDYLEELEASKYSEIDIFNMLNRKFKKLRRFNERNGLKTHRFKKRDFNEYVKDYQGYMQSSGKRGKKIYEAEMEDYSFNKREQIKYRRLANQPLEYFTSSDESDVVEDPKSLTNGSSDFSSWISNKALNLQKKKLTSSEIDQAQYLFSKQTAKLIPVTQTKSEPLECNNEDLSNTSNVSSQVSIVESISNALNPSNVSPHISSEESIRAETKTTSYEESIRAETKLTSSEESIRVETKSTSSLTITPLVTSNISYNNLEPLRTRRRTYAQQHPFNCDLATFLGLSTASHLNDLFMNGQTEEQIMEYLESRYKYHRERRKRLKIPRGPFEPSTLKLYMEDSRKRNDTQKKLNQNEDQNNHDRDSQIKEFVDDDDGFETSDDEYVYDDNDPEADSLSGVQIPKSTAKDKLFLNSAAERSDLTLNLTTKSLIRGYEPNPSDSDSNSESESGNADIEDNSSKTSSSDSFVYRKRKYKKANALLGVLPASFYKIQELNNTKSKSNTSSLKQKRTPDNFLRPGIARRKKTLRKVDIDDGLNQFIAGDDESDPLNFGNEQFYRDIDLDPANSINNTESLEYNNGYSGHKSDQVIDLQNLSDDLLSTSSNFSDDDIGAGSDGDSGVHDMYRIQSVSRHYDDGNGGAQEDKGSGIDYLLSRGESTSSGGKIKDGSKRVQNKTGSKLNHNTNRRALNDSNPKGYSKVKNLRRGSLSMRSRQGEKRGLKGYGRKLKATWGGSKSGLVQSKLMEAGPIWLDDEIRIPSVNDTENSLKRSWSNLEDVSGIYEVNQRCTPSSKYIFSSKGNSKGHSKGNFNDYSNMPHAVFRSKSPVDNTSKINCKRQKENRSPDGLQFPIDNMFYKGRGKIVATMQMEGPARNSPTQGQLCIKSSELSNRTRSGLSEIENSHSRLQNTETDLISSNITNNLQSFTIEMFQELQPKSTSFANSFLLKQCILPNGGNYFKHDSILFEFKTIDFSISLSEYDECSTSINALLRSIVASFKNSNTLDSRSSSQLRKCYIRLVQLFWNLRIKNIDQLKHIGRLLLSSSTLLLNYITSYKQILFNFPYLMLLLKLIDKLLKQSPESNSLSSLYGSVALKFQKKIIMACCSLSTVHFFKYLRGSGANGSSSYLMESMSTFTSLCDDSWDQIATLSKEYQFKSHNVSGFLYFLHSRSPVITNWEYYIQEIEHFMKNRDTTIYEWKEFFIYIRRIIFDLHWELDEKLLLKLYKLLSSQRFENVGSTRTIVLFYNSLPTPSIFTQTEGCLDCFLKLLVLFVSKFMDPVKESSLVEKLNPVGDISTCTNSLLKNRANLLLVMVMLFKKDFVQHFGAIFKVFNSFKTLDSYKSILELIRVITKIYQKEFDKLPIGIIKSCLSKIVSIINESILFAEGLSSSLSYFFDILSNYFKTSTDISKNKVEQIIDIAVITLKLRRCDRGDKTAHPVETMIGIIQYFIPHLSLGIIMNVKIKLENDFIVALKSIILTESIKNEHLKRNCFSLWTYISSRLKIPVDSLIHLQWAYFGSAKLRENYQLLFFANLIEFYSDIDLKNNLQILINMLISNLPLRSSPYFYKYFSILSKQPCMKHLLVFKYGVNIATLSEFEFRKNKVQVSIKILARILNKCKQGFASNEEESYLKLLEIFLDSLNKEYWKDKYDATSDHEYAQYVTRIISYLKNVGYLFIKNNPSYKNLKHELVLTDKHITLSESIDSIDSINDFIILISSEYITAFVNDKLSIFETEVVGFISDPINNLHENKQISSLYSIIMITSFHFDSLYKDKIHWIHIRNWLSILVKLIRCKSFLTLSDILFLIKLLLLSGSSSDYKCAEFQYCIDVIIDLSEEIIVALSHSLNGFEDKEIFINQVSLLNALGEKDGGSVKPRNSLYNSDINTQLSKLFLERSVLLRRHTERSSNHFFSYIRSSSIHGIFNRQFFGRKTVEDEENITDNGLDLLFL